jgi:hypothetical protein
VANAVHHRQPNEIESAALANLASIRRGQSYFLCDGLGGSVGFPGAFLAASRKLALLATLISERANYFITRWKLKRTSLGNV